MFTTPLLILACLAAQTYGFALPQEQITPIYEDGPPVAGPPTLPTIDLTKEPEGKVTTVYLSEELADLVKGAGVKQKRQALNTGVNADQKTLYQQLKEAADKATISSLGGPFYDRYSRNLHGDDCASEFSHCASARLWTRYLMTELSSVTVEVHAETDVSRPNHGQLPLMVEMTESTAKAQATTQGWKGGAKFSGLSKFGIELNAEVSHSQTDTITQTKSYVTKASCPGKHECRFETRTFTLLVKGVCTLQYGGDCTLGKENFCGPRQFAKSCSTLTFWKNNCSRRDTEHCEVRIPTMKDNGDLVSQVAFVEVPIN